MASLNIKKFARWTFAYLTGKKNHKVGKGRYFPTPHTKNHVLKTNWAFALNLFASFIYTI